MAPAPRCVCTMSIDPSIPLCGRRGLQVWIRTRLAPAMRSMDGWRGRDLPGFNGEPLHLGFDHFSQGLLVTISIRRRIETSGPLRDDRLLEGERLRESFEIKKAAGEGTRMRTLRVLAATAGVRPTRRWREP